MSLEAEIKKLTAAVEALTTAMTATKTETAPTQTESVPGKEMPTVEEVYENSPPNAETEPKAAEALAKKDSAEPANAKLTKESLQAWCLTKVRSDKTFKQKLMATLGEYDVKTIGALPDDKVSEVYSKLGGDL